MAFLSLLVSLLALKVSADCASDYIPPGAVSIPYSSFAVLEDKLAFRNDTTPFNPTNSTLPVFQVFDKEFLAVIGCNPSFKLIAENATFAFAHEAPVYVSKTDEVFFASNGGGHLGDSGLYKNNRVFKIDLKEAEASKEPVEYIKIPLPEYVQMTNGGTPYKGNIIFMNQGRGDIASNIILVNPEWPYNSTIILDNFFGRAFNSLNDIKIHPTSGAWFFCDPAYGFYQAYRPAPTIPNQVYRYDPKTGSIRVIADGINKPNGLAFSADGRTAYVTDTGAVGVLIGNNYTLPATIYQYDVDPITQSFSNRRVFAYSDNGIPDGIQLDTDGRVYAGCGDGVQVWNPAGVLIGKFFLGHGSSNMIFAGPGRLVMLAETQVYLVSLSKEIDGQDLEAL